MASIYDLKPKFQALLRPFCGKLAAAGVTANQVTITACLMSFAYGGVLLVTRGAPVVLALLPLILFIRMAFNAIDGMLAREFGQKSNLGAVLNELTDVLSDAALYLPFSLITGLDPALVVIIVVLAVVAEMTGVIGVQIGASRRYDGPFGKSDRAFFFGLLAVIIATGVTLGVWGSILLVTAIVFSVITIINRARGALKEAQNV